MEGRFLPIGIQDFEKLRKGNHVYVDKTALIYQLAQTSTPYFLSRPRRFGKSLLLSTMEYYFQGRKDLFEGLAIAEKEKDWTEWPVLKISFGLNSYEDNARLKARLNAIASEYERLYGIERQGDDPAERLADVIRTAYKKTGKPYRDGRRAIW